MLSVLHGPAPSLYSSTLQAKEGISVVYQMLSGQELHTQTHTHTHTHISVCCSLLIAKWQLPSLCVDVLLSSVTTTCSSDHFTSVAHDSSCISVHAAVWTYTRPNSKVFKWPGLHTTSCSPCVLFLLSFIHRISWNGGWTFMFLFFCKWFLLAVFFVHQNQSVLFYIFTNVVLFTKYMKTKSWEQKSKYGILGAWAVVNTVTKWLIQSAAMATPS